MAVVTDLPTGRVQGQYIFVSQDTADEGTSPDAVLVTGTVRFTCSATPPLIYKALKVSAVPLTHEAQFDAQGFLVPLGETTRYMELLADVDGVNPRGFTWNVSFNLTEVATGRAINIPSFNIHVTGGSVIDLTDVQSVGSSNGVQITRGESAYEIAVRNGFVGTEAEWIASLGVGGSNPVLLLSNNQPVPEGTRSGTLIIRSAGVVEPTPPVVTPPSDLPAPTVVMASVTTKGSPSGRSISLSKPPCEVGDVIVAAIHSQAASGTTLVPPAGWTVLAGGIPNNILRMTVILAHRVTADSPEQWAFDYSSTGRMVAGLFVVKGVSAATLSSGSGESTASAGQNATVGAFPLSGRSLVIMAAHAQVTTNNPWPLPSTIDNPAMSKVFEVGDNEANKETMTNSVLSVYAGPADAFPTTAIRYGQFVSTTAALAAGLLSA